MRVAGQFTQLWENAAPQGAGSYWPKTRMAERIVDLNQPVEAVMRHVHAFGATGSFVFLGGAWLTVKRAVDGRSHTMQFQAPWLMFITSASWQPCRMAT